METAALHSRRAVREGACLKPKLGGPWGAPSWSEGALDCLYTSSSTNSLHEGLDEGALGGPQFRGPLRQEAPPSCPSLPASKELFNDLETVPFKGGPQGALDLLLASPVRNSGGLSPLHSTLSDDHGQAETQQQQHQQQQQQQQEDSGDANAEVALLLRQQLQQLRRDGQLRAARLRRERQQLQQELAEARQQQQLLQLRRQQHRSSSSSSSRSSARKRSDNSSDEGWVPETLPQLPRGGIRGAPLEAPPFRGAPWPSFSPRMVLLHVYDLTPAISAYVNRVMRPLGAGAFHAGVEVYGQEYCFGQTPGRLTWAWMNSLPSSRPSSSSGLEAPMMSSAAEAAATAAAATAAAATTAAASLGRFFKQAHQVRDKKLRVVVGAPQGPPQRLPAEPSQGAPEASPASLDLDIQGPSCNTKGPLAPAGATRGVGCCSKGAPWYSLLNSLPCALLRPLKEGKEAPGGFLKGPPKCICCKRGPWWKSRHCRRPREAEAAAEALPQGAPGGGAPSKSP
ncbi:hypothetical protein Emag_007025 [Eimeria magna]